jgi:hypothetical protein
MFDTVVIAFYYYSYGFSTYIENFGSAIGPEEIKVVVLYNYK